MRKKYYLLMLVSALIIGTIAAYLPTAKATPEVRFYVWTTTTIPPGNIIPGVSMGGFVVVEVWVDSPPEWDDTASGITAYALSMRVDPRALAVYEAYPADKMRPAGQNPATYPPGFLEEFLLEYGYAQWIAFPPPGTWSGYATSFKVGETSAALGYVLDVYEGIVGFETLGVGAGGTSKLCQFFFIDNTGTMSSPIDICGPPAGTPLVVVEKASYYTPDGTEHTVDVMDDGYYRSQTPDIMFLDALGASPYDPAAPIGSHWHELQPVHCREWVIESWDDQGLPVLDESDQIDMRCQDTGFYAWYHVEWVNPEPVEGDGKVDLIVKFKIEIPEFPLGVGLMLALAPAIPIVYLWRKRKRVV